MTRLVRVEVLRLLSRRLVRVVAAAVLALVAVIVVVDGAQHSNADGAALAAYDEQRLAGYEQQRRQFERDRAAGQVPPDARFPTREEAEGERGMCFPAEQDFQCSPPAEPFLSVQQLPDVGRAVAVICTLMAFVLGASAAGAEWAAGTMQSLLVWEPRRVRVVLAKVVALLVVVSAIALAAQAVWTGGGLAAGATRGSNADLTAGFWTSQALLVSRALGMACFAAAVGFAIAFGTRVTAAAVGAGFVWFAVLEQVLLSWKAWLAPYLVAPQLGAWLEWGLELSDGEQQLVVHGARAGTTLLLYALVLLALATAWFRARDIP